MLTGIPCSRASLNAGRYCVADVGIVDDHVGALGDRGTEVGQWISRGARERLGAHVDDLPDLRVRERLEDELHLRHFAIDVLSERLQVGRGQLAARARIAAVLLPALQRQVQVDGIVGTSKRGERDLLLRRIGRQERRVEQGLLDHGRVGVVGLAVLVGPGGRSRIGRCTCIGRRLGLRRCLRRGGLCRRGRRAFPASAAAGSRNRESEHDDEP